MKIYRTNIRRNQFNHLDFLSCADPYEYLYKKSSMNYTIRNEMLLRSKSLQNRLHRSPFLSKLPHNSLQVPNLQSFTLPLLYDRVTKIENNITQQKKTRKNEQLRKKITPVTTRAKLIESFGTKRRNATGQRFSPLWNSVRRSEGP